MKNKEVIVLFTGGLDSTFLIYKNLMDGNTVQPVYISLNNNERKTLLEKKNIEELYSIFKKSEFKGSILPIKYIAEIKLEVKHKFYLTQPIIWLFAMSFAQFSDFDEIQIGYVSGDDAISFLNDIHKIYNSFSKFCIDKLIPLKFPLSKIGKSQIIDELPIEYAEKVFSCEDSLSNDEFIPCGRCATCSKYNYLFSIQDYYTTTNKFPKLINKEYIEELKKLKYSFDFKESKIIKDECDSEDSIINSPKMRIVDYKSLIKEPEYNKIDNEYAKENIIDKLKINEYSKMQYIDSKDYIPTLIPVDRIKKYSVEPE